MQKNVSLPNKAQEFKFHLWDTGGAEKFRSLQPLYYRDTDAAIIAYSITDEKSFESIKFWTNELEEHGEKKDIVVCIVGNKNDSDPERLVPSDIGRQFAEERGYYFIECSAKTGINVYSIFKYIANKHCEQRGYSFSSKSSKKSKQSK